MSARILIIAAFVAATGSQLFAIEGPPPTEAEVAGVWSGYASYSEFLRLELDRGGSGYLSVMYIRGHPSRLYRVERWQVVGSDIRLLVRPIDKDAESITFGPVVYFREALEGEFGGSTWKRAFKLYSEREWKLRSSPARERISQYRREHTR